MYICTYMYVYIYICICIYIYNYECIHTHITEKHRSVRPCVRPGAQYSRRRMKALTEKQRSKPAIGAGWFAIRALDKIAKREVWRYCPLRDDFAQVTSTVRR